MTPLAGDALRSAPDLPARHHASADSGPQDHAEHHPSAVRRRGAEHRLGQREAVGVVVEGERAAERAREIGAKWPPVEANQVGVLHEAGAPHRPSGHPHADGDRRRALPRGDAPDQLLRPGDDGLVSFLAPRRHAPPVQHLELAARPAPREHGLDLGPAEVDANDQRGGHEITARHGDGQSVV